MKPVVIIPARMASHRFPGKPLFPLNGKPMLQHIYERCALAHGLSGVYIATCDREIANTALSFGAEIIMTSKDHARATERVAEAARHVSGDTVVLVQGDEPLVTPRMIDEALCGLRPNLFCTNLAVVLRDEQERADQDVIKVPTSLHMNAMYMSRQPIAAYYKQVCVMAFHKTSLARYIVIGPMPLEVHESIDMLRVLEYGETIRMVETHARTHAVDRPEDVPIVEELLRLDALT